MKLPNIVTIILSFFLILAPSLVHAGSFDKVFVFGDSLSDTGNLAALPDFNFLNQPPYDRGFSNGPRAVEVLAKALGLSADPSLHLVGLSAGTNYAVAGARARGNSSIDLLSQINAFLLGAAFEAPSDALYVIFIGGNDVRDARDEKSLRKVRRILYGAVDAIDEAIRTLVASGAKSILVVNSPDLGVVPETSAIAQNHGVRRFVRSASLKTQFFNRHLARSLAKIKQDSEVDLVNFDLFTFFRSVIRNRSALGFTYASEGCFNSETFTFNMDCENGENIDQFVFFDEFHPSARSNKRAGRAFFALVPEPTAIILNKSVDDMDPSLFNGVIMQQRFETK